MSLRWLAFDIVLPPIYALVQDLLKKIEADAQARLPLPPNADTAEKLARYKGFLKVETHRLKLLHAFRQRAGARFARAARRCSTRCCGISGKRPRAACRRRRKRNFRRWRWWPSAVTAAAELNPHSDIDFMFLHDGQIAAGKPLPYLSRLIDGVLYPLWDIGLKVGHAVRSMDDCVNVANSDMQSKTSLIEARLIVGERGAVRQIPENAGGQMRRRLRGKIHRRAAGRPGDAARQVRQFRLHAGAEHQERLRRPARFPEPAVDGVFQIPHAFVARTGAAANLSATAERQQLEAAYDFLLRARTELHYHVNRPLDVLGKNLQPAVAHNLGYDDRSPEQAH